MTVCVGLFLNCCGFELTFAFCLFRSSYEYQHEAVKYLEYCVEFTVARSKDNRGREYDKTKEEFENQ